MKQCLFFLVALSGGGCALTDLTLRAPEVPAVARQCTSTRPLVTLVTPLEDNRPQKKRCGMKKNSYNMDTADIFCGAEPAQYLAGLLAVELDKAGFEVRHTSSLAASASTDGVQLEGQLLQFFVEPAVGFATFTPEADAYVRLLATSASGLKAERDFYVKWEETSIVGTEDNFQIAADKATSGVVINMAHAVQELLERYPQLKTRTAGNSTQGQPCS
ncbi:MAG: hypothetical protein ACJ8AT_28290 [Hyalangium sp.]|uniref:hypothetical protein n=1 Tax=Hyalangium sp. TaxID=2028555 RepID=UPI003899B51D